MKTVREVDLVHGAIGPRPRVREGVGDRGDRENPSALGHQTLIRFSRAGVKNGDALHLLSRVYCANCAAAGPRQKNWSPAEKYLTGLILPNHTNGRSPESATEHKGPQYAALCV